MSEQEKRPRWDWCTQQIRRVLHWRPIRLRSHVVIKCLFCESSPGQQHEPQCQETGVMLPPAAGSAGP